ncbi:MAG: hypothetical protein KGI13_09105 [Betaproteobacteria bacterium]|nr:hypothetical protein [Betaproteobacteria bacterium]
MAVRPRYLSLLADEKWQAAFGRQTSVEKILDYVVTSWVELQKHPPADMNFSEPEPRITKFFTVHLFKNAKANGITGIFIPEHPVADIVETKQELDKRGRTDITYYSDRIDPALQFVFEFKKLKPTPWGKASRLKYAEDGIIRFVDGIYGRGADLGFMVGLVDHECDAKPVAEALKRRIQGDDLSRFLRIIHNEQGDKITSPARTFKICTFETYHARDHVKDSPDIVLGHLILSHRT